MATKEGEMPNEEKHKVISTEDIRYLRNKIKNKGRKSLTEKERKEAMGLGVIK